MFVEKQAIPNIQIGEILSLAFPLTRFNWTMIGSICTNK